MSEKIQYYKELIEKEPKNTYARLHLGLEYLREKNYEEGWKYFEYRLEGLNVFPPSLPAWNGEDITDKTLLVYAERGLGDTIMFSRFLPLLQRKCARVLFLPHAELFNLFDETSLGVKLIQDVREICFDAHTSVMSLPYKLKIFQEKNIPEMPKQCLIINQEKFESYKQKYFNNDNFKAGINWQGNIKLTAERSIPLKCFEKLFSIPNTSFYSLQKGEGQEQLNSIEKYNVIDLGSTFNDFSDTAAAIENLDLVISNDTSVANLAGAMGKECWILLNFIPDWRWSNDLSYCPWYKNVKLFKQAEKNEWDSVFDAVYKDLLNAQ